jgi:Cu(I)/Ag(I) efflux system membrane protein CusA/SilA
MIETIIQFKPKSEWRAGVTRESLRLELDSLLQLPGVSNSWVMPIKTRIDMLATGIKTPVGIKVAGPDMVEIEKIGKQLESILPAVRGTASVYSERVDGGRYVKVDIDRVKAARYGLNIADVQAVINTAIGGSNVTETVEGVERFPVNLRYPQRYRDSAEQLKLLPIVTATGNRIALADIARVYVDGGPPSIKSENARLNGWSYVSIEGRDLGSYVAEAQQLVAEQLQLPPGYSLTWAGQYEYLERAKQKLLLVVPLAIATIVLLLYLNFRRWDDVLIILLTLPLALVGSLWFMLWQRYDFSVAVMVGFIALAGVAVEIGVLMLTYLHQAWDKQRLNKTQLTRNDLRVAVMAGAGQRVRPIIMTVLATMIGLLPIMFGEGTGSEVMQRIAGPMIGGMLTAVLLSLLVLPAIFYLYHRRALIIEE